MAQTENAMMIAEETTRTRQLTRGVVSTLISDGPRTSSLLVRGGAELVPAALPDPPAVHGRIGPAESGALEVTLGLAAGAGG
ncbi:MULTISPECIES: hypothetical protein [Citricoccus]|uniref:hypothetical protein n=1 Tax=Citricoccus TaxID=169133 RepID=UPI00048ED72A|nr:hypothetical protein [Citricoccus sp. CH26A]